MKAFQFFYRTVKASGRRLDIKLGHLSSRRLGIKPNDLSNRRRGIKPDDLSGRRLDIKLDHFGPCQPARISHGNGHPVSIEPHVYVVKGCVGQPVTKWPANLHAGFVVVPVAHINTFPVLGVLRSIAAAGRTVTVCKGPAFCQFATRIGLTVKQSGGSLPSGLPRQPHVQDRLHPVRPWAFHHTAAQQHHDGVWIGFCHRLDHSYMALRHGKVLPVKALGFISVRKPGKYYRSFCILCGGNGLRK